MTFEFKGNPLISMYLGFGTLIMLSGLAIGFIFIGTLEAVITGMVLLALVAFILSKTIRRVYFNEGGIEVNYYLGKTRHVRYQDVKKFYESNDGILPAQIFVIKHENKHTKGKITFACSDNELEALLETYFDGKRVRKKV